MNVVGSDDQGELSCPIQVSKQCRLAGPQLANINAVTDAQFNLAWSGADNE
jgi:hypothetical protein